MRVQDQIRPIADRIFGLLMKVFSTKHATAHAEAYMAMGALASGALSL